MSEVIERTSALVAVTITNETSSHSLLSSENMNDADYSILLGQILPLSKYIKNCGITYSPYHERFFFVYLKPTVDNSILLYIYELLLPESITFYYKQNILISSLSDVLENVLSSNSIKNQSMQVLDALNTTSNTILENIFHILSPHFLEPDTSIFLETIHDALPELLYSLLWNKVVIISNLPADRLEQMEGAIAGIFPYLNYKSVASDTISDSDFRDNNFILTSTAVDAVLFPESLLIDYNEQSATNKPNKVPDILRQFADEAIMVDKAHILPFQSYLHGKLFNIVEKVPGTLIFSMESVDFSNFIIQDEIELKPLYEYIFEEIILR